MKHRHVISRFQAWSEGRAGESERRDIVRHLERCDDCRRYFEKMTKLMEGIGANSLPHLEPDPFVPERIRAIAREIPASRAETPAGTNAIAPFRPAFGRLALSLTGVAALAAVAIGIVFGAGLSGKIDTATRAENAAIVEAYYEAFSPSDIQSNWESALEADKEDDA